MPKIEEKLGWSVYSPELDEESNRVFILFEEIPVEEKYLETIERLEVDFVEDICSIVQSYARERFGRELKEIGRFEIEPVALCHSTPLGFELSVYFNDPRMARIFEEEIQNYIERKLNEKYSCYFR
jgi:hypothetical protein